MGNIGSSHGRSHRRSSNQNNQTPHPPPPPQPEINGNRYVFAAATPYPAHYPNTNTPPYYQYPGYYPPPPPVMMPATFDHHNRDSEFSRSDTSHSNWPGRGYGCGPMLSTPAPVVEHQKAITIRNDVNLKKETLKIEPDEDNPGQFLVSFIFDATTTGHITILFFAKEGADCSLTPMKGNLLSPITVSFELGLGQKFRQPSGTGINLSLFKESELLGEEEKEVYPLVIKAEATQFKNIHAEVENQMIGATNSQITQAVFEKEKGEFHVKVVKQLLWVNRMRYELQEIYGIGNSVDGDCDGNDPGKECVICLSEPSDTTVLPCRHMCMCNGCAEVLRFQTNRCPICRQPVERLLEIKVNNKSEA